MTKLEANDAASPVHSKKTSRISIKASGFWRLLPAGMRKRWWLFRPFDLIARNLPIISSPHDILVVRMDGIGDMTLFRQSLEYYAEAFEVAKGNIIILGCQSWGPISGELFPDYKVITINEHAFARNVLYRFFISIRVRMLGIRVAVCDSYYRRAMMADSLVWVSGAPKTIVSYPYINEATRAEFLYYLSQVSEIIDTGDYPTHELVRHAKFVSALLNREIIPEPPSISLPQTTTDFSIKRRSYVVLVPGSNEPGRRWPIESYMLLAGKYVNLGYQVLIVGQAGETVNKKNTTDLKLQKSIKDYRGKTSLLELLHLLANAALVITNDTGPAHLSIAIGAPTIVMVGGGHYKSFFPYPAALTPINTRFISHTMSCYNCFWRCTKRTEPSDSYPCIEQINLELVWQASKELLHIGQK